MRKLLWTLVTPRQVRWSILAVLLVWLAVAAAHHYGVFNSFGGLLPIEPGPSPRLPRQVPGT